MTARATRVVRRIPGPFLTRACVCDSAGFHWIERLRRADPVYLDADRIAVLREHFDDGAIVWPVVVATDTAMWRRVGGPALLSDRVLDARRGKVAPALLRAAGALAGSLHEVPVAGGLRDVLPDRWCVDPWLCDKEISAAVARARSSLALDGVPELADAASSPAREGAPRLVHGRYSVAMWVDSPVPRVLGWREAGLGDPMRDVAHFVADLTESSAAVGRPEAWSVAAVAEFLGAYRASRTGALDLGALWDLVARRVIDHYAQGVWATGAEDGIGASISRVRDHWLAVREGVP